MLSFKSFHKFNTLENKGDAQRDSYVLSMISTYLSDGKTSKLYKKMVDDKKMALQVGALDFSQEDYGTYILYGLPLGDVSLDDLIVEMDEEILKLQENLSLSTKY